MKTLGAYVSLIPAQDQETMVAAVSLSRDASIHRGMLAMIPIEEIMTALRTAPNAKVRQQLQLQQMQQAQIVAYQQYQQNYQAGTGTTTVITSSGGSGGNIYSYPQSIGALGGFGTSNYQNYPQFSVDQNFKEECQFAYSALMVAYATIKLEQLKENIEDECDRADAAA